MKPFLMSPPWSIGTSQSNPLEFTQWREGKDWSTMQAKENTPRRAPRKGFHTVWTTCHKTMQEKGAERMLGHLTDSLVYMLLWTQMPCQDAEDGLWRSVDVIGPCPVHSHLCLLCSTLSSAPLIGSWRWATEPMILGMREPRLWSQQPQKYSEILGYWNLINIVNIIKVYL